jgi:L-arabinose isomerase
MSKEIKLRLFANWLCSHEEYKDTHSDLLESAIEYAKQDVINKIGDMLIEILDMPEEDVEKQLQDYVKCKKCYRVKLKCRCNNSEK